MKSTIQQTQRLLWTVAGIAALCLAACGDNQGNPTGTPSTGPVNGGTSGSTSGGVNAGPGNGNSTVGNGNTTMDGNSPVSVTDGNATFNPNALKFAYFGTEVSTTGTPEALVAVIISADPNLCTSGKFGPVKKGSVDLSGIATCTGNDCSNATMTVQVDTHPAATTAGECSLYGDQANGSATIKGTAKFTGTTASVALKGSVADPNNPNTPISFDYSMTPTNCQFPITATPAATDTVSCQ